MIEFWKRLWRYRSRYRTAFLLIFCLQCTSTSSAMDKGLENYRDLMPISYFDSISVSIHDSHPNSNELGSGLSPEEMTQYLRSQFAIRFPEVPYRAADPSEQDSKGMGLAGQLLCRIWIDRGNTPTVFQVRCQISTSSHFNIIDDASYGYGPEEKVSVIVHEQIDQILKGLAAVYFKVRSEL